MPVRVAQRPPSGLLHSGPVSSLVPISSGLPTAHLNRCLGGRIGSPPLPPVLSHIPNHNHNHNTNINNPNNNNNNHINGIGSGPNPLQAMASAAASLTQLNNMANGPLPPLGSGPSGPNLPPPPTRNNPNAHWWSINAPWSSWFSFKWRIT